LSRNFLPDLTPALSYKEREFSFPPLAGEGLIPSPVRGRVREG